MTSAERGGIWLISKYFSPREHGFETRSFAMARHWAAAGRQVVVIASDSNHLAKFPALAAPQVEETIDGVRCVWLRVMRYTRSASLRRVVTWLHFEWRLLRLEDSRLPHPAVVVVSSLSLFTIHNGLRLRRRFRCKLVFEVRDIWPLTLVEEGGFSRWHPLSLVMAWLERLAYRRSDLVIGTMPNLGPHASRIAGRRIRCECIPFGFEPAEVAAAEANPPQVRRIERRRDQLVVGYAGSMGKTNALDTIVQCIVDLRDDPRFKFMMVGDGDLRAHFQTLTAGCPNVEWIGRVPRAEVRAWLDQCDLLYFAVHDSKVWESGMSLNKLTDYLLAAKPVLASYSGFPSILDESGCGEYLPSRDQKALLGALERYAAMPPQQRARMGAAGRRWLFEHRTWATLAEHYLAILDSVVASAAR